MDDGQNSVRPVVTIVPTTPQHINYIKANLRPEDEGEILRFGVSVKHALWYSYKHSLIRKTALIDGIVGACWGCQGTLLGHTGVVWLMTTPEVKRVSPLKFARVYQGEVLKMLTRFKKLENIVESSYSAAIRLLEITGFTVEESEVIGNGSYRRFWIE